MTSPSPTEAAAPIKIGVAQMEAVQDLGKTTAAIIRQIGRAASEGCRFVAIPEGALDWPEGTPKERIDAAIGEIRAVARARDIYVCVGVHYKDDDEGKRYNRGLVVGPDGAMLTNYKKSHDVPQRFLVDGIRCNIAVCSDRWMRELADLPCLVQGSQIIVELSGGHGGDDGRPELRWIRYRPWAQRNNAFIVLSSGVHHTERSFLNQLPWGGHSAIINPDGTFAARAHYEDDCLITAIIDPRQATRREAERRRRHPLLAPFWEAGKTRLEGGRLDADEVSPFESAETEITIAAAQIACARDISHNIESMRARIAEAAASGADVVVFPELAVTGYRGEDVARATPAELEGALAEIAAEARRSGVSVVFGMPHGQNGSRTNSAFAIGPDGRLLTRYDQLNVTRPELFTPGSSTRAMWFTVKGVHAVLTIGDDVLWDELGELAAYRGAQMQFHLMYDPDTTPDGTVLRKMKGIQMVSCSTYSAVVNAADPSGLPNPSTPANGASMICEHYAGGHNKPDPGGVELYLPYHANVIVSADGRERIIYAARRTRARNNHRSGTNNTRRKSGWYGWILRGMDAIRSEARERCPAD